MPYVTPEAKDRLDHGHVPQTVGELTYEMQQLAQRYLLRHCANGPDTNAELSYARLGEVLTALEGCKADFIDRILLPYEACKAAENGDVWDARLIATNREVPTLLNVPCLQAWHHLPHNWAAIDGVVYHCTGA